MKKTIASVLFLATIFGACVLATQYEKPTLMLRVTTGPAALARAWSCGPSQCTIPMTVTP